MPRYAYTSDWPAVFPNLEAGVNAVVIPGDGRGDPPVGSTVELFPGDEVETTEPYSHAWLTEVPAAAAPAPAPAPAPES